MKFNENINIPQKGMNTDTHSSQLGESDYIFALNSTMEDYTGSFAMLGNEPSNLLCSKFKDGYKVVGFKSNFVEDKVYFWLTNPTNKRSEIGYIQGSPKLANSQDLEVQCGCDIIRILDTPLEEVHEFFETCTYTTLTGDNCVDESGEFIQEKPCLNFDLNHPIREGNIIIKVEKTGNKIYWTDGLNPQRALDLFKLEQGYYSKTGVVVCDVEYNVEDVCLDCEKLNIFKRFDKPCIEPENLIVGGSLPMGIYQFLIAYCDIEGNELSPYYSMTNPISIFDHNKTDMSQAELSNKTNLGIKLSVINLDVQYPYYKVVVIKRNDQNFTESYLVEGIHPISETTILYDREYVDNKRITLDQIQSLNPIYGSAEIMTSSGGYLFQGDLKTHGEINLQPVVNLMGGFLKWKSSKAKEDLYRDGVNVSLYTGYMRDEVYPFGIRFFTNKGFVTPIFPFISRPASVEELEDYKKSGLNYKSLLKYVPECSEYIREKVWQFENTATVDGYAPCRKNTCTEESDNCEEIVQELTKACIANSYSIKQGSSDSTTQNPDGSWLETFSTPFIEWTFSPKGSYSGLLNELNSDLSILQENHPTLYSLIEGGFPDIHCTPKFNIQEGDDCTEPEKFGDDLIFISEVTEIGEPSFTPKNSNDYVLLQDVPTSEDYDEDYVNQTPCTTFVLNNKKPTKDVALANLLASKLGIDDATRFNTIECDIFTRNSFDDTTSSKPCIKNILLKQTNFDGKKIFNRQDVYPGWEVWIPRYYPISSTENAMWNLNDCPTETLLSLNSNIINYTDSPCGVDSAVCPEPYFIAHKDYDLDKAFSKYSSTINFTEALSLGFYYKSEYENKIASNATWLKVKRREDGKDIILDFSRKEDSYEDYMTAKEVRISFFKDCDSLSSYRAFLLDPSQGFIGTDALNPLKSSIIKDTEFIGDYIYIAIDTQLKAVSAFDQPRDGEGKPGDWKYRAIGFVNRYIDGCLTVTYREEEYSSVTVRFDKLLVDKKENYKISCTYFQKTSDSCGVSLDKIGDFGYYESLKEYPDNKELYDSSYLNIKKDLIPESIKDKFEDYYVSPELNVGDTYNLDYDQTNFRCKPIRHYRFPSNALVPFMNTRVTNTSEETDIYPLGVFIDNEVIESFLQIAVENNLISQQFKDDIVGYDILRGDRTLDKSVIARGLLFDVYEYKEGNKKALYSNYPYNDLGDDILNMTDVNRYSAIQHPFNGNSNNRFTFHSPDLHFNPPTVLPSELNFDGYVFGKSKGVFSEVINHPKWVILGDRAYSVANTLATAECVVEAIIAAAEASSRANVWFVAGVSSGASLGIPSFAAAALIAGTLAVGSVMFKYARYRNQWLETIKNFGTPKNFTSYYTSVGHYNYFLPHEDDSSKGNFIRGLAFSKLMRQGNHNVIEKFGNQGSSYSQFMFNNTDREFTYFLSFGNGFNIKYEDFYKTFDNNRVDNTTSSKTHMSIATSCGGDKYQGVSNEIIRNIASPYVTLKTYIPSQYGSLNSIRWINTNYCGKLYDLELNEANNSATKTVYDNNCDIIFGGDSFISRFSVKRKFPFFYINAMNESDMLPFNYAAYRNVGYPKFYVDYGVDDSLSLGSISMPSMINDYKFDCLYGKNTFYVRPPSKFYLFYYGIPNFLVESEINCNFRYAGRQLFQEFYPQTGNYVDWTQESKVSIKTPEVFNYNNVYSSRAVLSGTGLNRTLPIDFNKQYWDRANNLENVVIYSEPDVSEIQTLDPWAVYKMNNKHQFATANGKLIDIRGIESEQILVRFENTFEIHNAVDQLKDRLNANTVYSGGGTLFSSRPVSYNNTDLGYGGTQHKALLSTEFGHFWADAMRGQVFMVDPNGRNLKEITKGKRNWFKEHLPFKIIKTVENMTHMDTDNNFKGLGLIFGYDSRFKRIFLTKRDYIAKVEGVFYKDGNFYIKQEGQDGEQVDLEVDLRDSEYFEDVSFTMAYSPYTESWISYYSFKPDYYISFNNYFQTGLNFSRNKKEEGLWSHLLTNKSYQVFYGKKYPWTIEVPFKNNMVNKVLESVSYWLDSRRYHNDYDFAEKRNEGFNKAWIYNNSNNSGRLDLITEEKNNLFQKTMYPKFTGLSNEILATENDKRWSFNYFFNEVRNELNNNPIWLWDKNSIEKFINIDTLNYRKVFKERLRGEWFNVVLSQDKETRFKYIFKWINTKENLYRN